MIYIYISQSLWLQATEMNSGKAKQLKHKEGEGHLCQVRATLQWKDLEDQGRSGGVRVYSDLSQAPVEHVEFTASLQQTSPSLR